MMKTAGARTKTTGYRNRVIRAQAVLALVAGLTACALHASEHPEELDRRFQTLATDAYRQLANQCGRQTAPVDDIDSLSPRELGCALQAFQSGEPSELQPLVPILLERELTGVVHTRLQEPGIQGQPNVRTQLQFALGRHAFEQGQWQNAQEWLRPLSSRYSLTGHQRQYLQLVEALELQRRGEHRQAIKRYERFEPDSIYYPEARTNLAIAYIRQDWWTDAHREINNLLDQPLEPEFKNRLRVLLGLSQLQQGFYRDARASFRTIEQGSQYGAHGWRGIGLSALHQGDFAGALNAFVYLKEAGRDALPEGPFLVAFTYDQMGKLTMAEASYTEAVLDYQNRLNELGRTLNRLINEDWLPDEIPTMDIVTLEFAQEQSSFQLEKQYRVLERLHRSLPSDAETTRRELGSLLSDYRQALAGHYRQRLVQQQEYLQSYLSQSQYGLATIYDRQ